MLTARTIHGRAERMDRRGGVVLVLAAGALSAVLSGRSASADEGAPRPGRVHVELAEPQSPGVLLRRAADASYDYLCALPCSADVREGDVFRVTTGGSSLDFTVADGVGKDVELVIRPKHSSRWDVGAASLAIGGGLVGGAGVGLIALGGFQKSANGLQFAGAFGLVVGGLMAVSGLVMLSDRGLRAERQVPRPAYVDVPRTSCVTLAPPQIEIGFSF